MRGPWRRTCGWRAPTTSRRWRVALARAFADDPIFDVARARRRRRRARPSGATPFFGSEHADPACKVGDGVDDTDERTRRGAVGAAGPVADVARRRRSGWPSPILTGPRGRALRRMLRAVGDREGAPAGSRTGTSPSLGTDPDHQGKGIGGAALAPVLERATRGRPRLPRVVEGVEHPATTSGSGSESTQELPLGRTAPPSGRCGGTRPDSDRPRGMTARPGRRALRRRRSTPVLVGLAKPPAPTPSKLRHDVILEAFTLACGFLAADGRQTDDELWDLIAAFGPHLDTELGGRDAGRRAPRPASSTGCAAEARRNPSEMFELLVDVDRARRHPPRPHLLRRRPRRSPSAWSPPTSTPRATSSPRSRRFRGRLLRAHGAARRRRRPGRRRPAAEPPTPPPPPTGAARAARGPARRARRPRRAWTSVKREVHLVADLTRVQQLRKERGLPVLEQSRHLVFTGNPGHRQDDRRPAAVAHLPHARCRREGPPRRDRPVRPRRRLRRPDGDEGRRGVRRAPTRGRCSSTRPTRWSGAARTTSGGRRSTRS